MRRTTRRILITCTALLLGATGPAAALELLPNGTFATSDEPYEGCCDTHGSVLFDPTRDASGSSRSGSAEVLRFTFSGAYALSYCVSGPEIEAGKALYFGAKVRFRTTDETPGDAYLVADFYSDTACATTRVGYEQVLLAHDAQPRGTWAPITIGKPTKGVVLPAGTKGVRVLVGVYTLYDSMALGVDDVFAAPVGTPTCDDMPATILGSGDDELLNGTEGSDVIVGRGGIDWIDGRGGNDRLCGGPGADILYGGTGDDRLFGGGGADQLDGAKDNDFLNGEGNNDVLDGGTGYDRLKGGSGKDTCDGGTGLDYAKTCETEISVN